MPEIHHFLCAEMRAERCPNNCHGNGKCVSGVCQCFPGFHGANCAEGAPTIPVIIAKPESPKEHQSLNLFCNMKGAVSFHWFLNKKLIVAGGRFYLSDEDQTLIVAALSMSDSRTSFICTAFHSNKNFSSRPYVLIISPMKIGDAPGVDDDSGKLPIWAVIIIVLIVLGFVASIVGIFHYYRYRHPLSRAHKRRRRQSNVAALPSILTPSDSPAIKQTKASGKVVKSDKGASTKSVRFAPETKLEDEPPESSVVEEVQEKTKPL